MELRTYLHKDEVDFRSSLGLISISTKSSLGHLKILKEMDTEAQNLKYPKSEISSEALVPFHLAKVCTEKSCKGR